MTKELLFRANDLQDCIANCNFALKKEKATIENLKLKQRREDGTISIEFSDVGLVRVLVEDIIKASEQYCEMLKEKIETQQKEFDEL